MAEEKDPINPLDPLGPQFGKINAPRLDLQSMQPFEGQNINPDIININYDPLPVGKVFPKESYNIKDKNVGHLFGEKPAKNPEISAKDLATALEQKLHNRILANNSNDTYARLYSYDAGPSGQNFYKRYAAFGDETFEKIGFSPSRNNEQIYNDSTTWLQNHMRMATNAAWPLFASGFTSGPRSLMRMLQGDRSTDPADAKIYAEAAAIGQDTRGGVGSFINNLQMNFAYTAGIMAEAIVEEAVGALLAPATGGTSFAAATLNNARKIPKIFSALSKAFKGMTTANAFNKSLKAADGIDNARKLFNAAKFEKAASSKLGRFVNPLENTTDAIFSSMKNADNLQGLARSYATVSKTAGGLYRDVRAVNMALAEARLEGGFTQNEIYNDLYREHYDKTGEAPDDAMQRDMRKQALEGGMETLNLNAGLIYLSNKIVFPNIVGPRGGLKSFLSSKTDDILDLKFGKIKKTMVTPEGSKVAKPKYEWVDKSFVNTVKETYKQPIRKLVPAMTGYFKANVMEGLQENFQEVIAEGTKNYYIETFKDPKKDTTAYYQGLMKTAFKEHFQNHGLETFASGFFMGFLGGGMNKSFEYLSSGVNYIKDKEAFAAHKAAKKMYGQKIVENMSNIDVKEFFNSKIFNFSEQLKTVSKESFTEKSLRDLKDQQLQSHLTQVLDHGMMDMFVDHLSSYKDLTPEEFQEALGFETLEEATAAQGKIDEVLAKSSKLQKRYDFYKERFPDPLNSKALSELESLGKDSEEYKNAQFLMESWRISRNNAVFFGETYDNTRQRMQSIVDDVIANTPLGKSDAADLNILFDTKKMYNEVDILKTEIESAEQAGVKNAEIANKKRKLDALNNLIEKSVEYSKYNRTDESLREEYFLNNLRLGIELSEEELDEFITKRKESLDEEAVMNSAMQYEKAFKNYLKTIGNISNVEVFDSNVDDAFTKLLDYYTLSDESKAMAKAVNILHDPQGFAEHVERNLQWMKELYNNRKDYYTDMVNNALNATLANDVINSLASEGIYMSAEDLENFMQYGILPEEFYDDASKTVIKRSNPLYKNYAQVLIKAKREMNNTIGKSTGSEKLDARIQELDNQMKAELDKLPKVEERIDLDPIDIQKGKTITYKSLLNKVEPGTYVDIAYFEKGEEKEATLYRTEEGFKFNNEEGAVVTFGNRTRISKAEPYKIEMVPDPEMAKEVIEKFDQLKAEAVTEDTEKEFQEPESTKPLGSDLDRIQQEAPELFSNLQELYEQSVGEDAVVKMDDAEYMEGFERFIKIDSQARQLIREYNEKKGIEASIKPGTISLKINYKNEEVDINDLPTDVLESEVTRREIYLETLEGDEKPNNTLIASVKREINTIKKLIAEREAPEITAEQQEVIDILEQLGSMEYPVVNGKYIIDNVLHERVSNVVERLSGKEYKYKSADVLNKLMLKVFKGKTLTAETLKQFIADVKNNIENESIESRRLSGFLFANKGDGTADAYGREVKTTLEKVEFALNELLKAKKGKPYSEIKEDISKIFAENTYEESRVMGNYIDDFIRDYFAGVEPKFDPNRITKKAYDSLVGNLQEIKEIIEKKGLYVYSKGITLYDSEAKVAGTIDLILVDQKGNIYIVDVKTGDANKWAHFTPDKMSGLGKDASELTDQDEYSKVENYVLQQAVYSNLLYNMIGRDSKISLLPIEQVADKTSAKITAINKTSFLKDGKYTISLNKDYRLTTDAEKTSQEKVDEAVPRKEKVTPTISVTKGTKANNTISNGDKIISVQTNPVTNEIKDTNGELFLTTDKDPEGRVYINMDSLKDILVVPNNTLTIIDKKTNKEIINKELNPEGAVIFEAMQGRLFVLANVNGQLVPFYKSSAGTSGKTQGAWYPFFGYTGAWLVKGGIDKATGKMSYSSEIDNITNLLNENLVFPDKYIDRATNTVKDVDGNIRFDFNDYFKVNRLWKTTDDISTGTNTNYSIKGLKENTKSESGAVALITGLNTTELDSSNTPKELSEWFDLIIKNAKPAASEGTKTSGEGAPTKSKEVLEAEALAKDVKENVSKASMEWVISKSAELAKVVDLLSVDTVTELGNLLNERYAELSENPDETGAASLSIEKNTKLIAQMPIFSKRKPNEQIGNVGDIAAVSKVDEAKGQVTVKIKSNGKTRQVTISLEELDKMFKLYNEVMGKDTTSTKPVSTEEQGTVKASNDAAANFVDNEELQKEADAEESKMTDDEVDNNLYDDLDCSQYNREI